MQFSAYDGEGNPYERWAEVPGGWDGFTDELGDEQRECTQEEATLWRERYSEGYRVGRGDSLGRYLRANRMTDIPDELPGETGAQYVARHVGIAWQVGYTRAAIRYAGGAR